MIKTKQKNMRVFEIECDDIEAFKSYVEKNAVLLENFLLLLRGVSSNEFADYCEQHTLCYAVMGSKDFIQPAPPRVIEAVEVSSSAEQEKTVQRQKSTAKKTLPKPQPKLQFDAATTEVKELAIPEDIKNVVPEPHVSESTVFVAKNLRSGESIDTKADVTVVGRINSGAKVHTSANAALFDTIDGEVDVGGEYLIIRSIGKGSVLFRGERITKEMLPTKKPKLITFDGTLQIKDIS